MAFSKVDQTQFLGKPKLTKRHLETPNISLHKQNVQSELHST